METIRFGLVLRVSDLPLCRRFYRDLLALGDPAADSPFAVEFEPSPHFTLRLEKNDSAWLEHASGAASWLLELPDHAALDALRRRLTSAGWPLPETPEERAGGRFFRGADPEGNCFFVTVRRPLA